MPKSLTCLPLRLASFLRRSSQKCIGRNSAIHFLLPMGRALDARSDLRDEAACGLRRHVLQEADKHQQQRQHVVRDIQHAAACSAPQHAQRERALVMCGRDAARKGSTRLDGAGCPSCDC